METDTLCSQDPGGSDVGHSLCDSVFFSKVAPGKYSLAGSTLTDSRHPGVKLQRGCHTGHSIYQMPNGAFEDISGVHQTEPEERIRARCTARRENTKSSLEDNGPDTDLQTQEKTITQAPSIPGAACFGELGQGLCF